MGKVYVVTSGSYRDYRIDCVFSDKQDAIDFVERAEKECRWSDYNGQEEYDAYNIGVLKSSKIESGWSLWSKNPILNRGESGSWDDTRIEGARIIRNDLDTGFIRLWFFGLPTGKQFDHGDQSYHMSFWGHPYSSRDNHYFQIPYMQGFGGSSVVLAPNGITVFRYTDAKEYDVESFINVAETIRQFPDGHVEPIW